MSIYDREDGTKTFDIKVIIITDNYEHDQTYEQNMRIPKKMKKGQTFMKKKLWDVSREIRIVLKIYVFQLHEQITLTVFCES